MSNQSFPRVWWARRPANGVSPVVILVLRVLAIAGSVALLATRQYTATIAIVLEWLVIALLSIDALRLIGGLVLARRGPR
jgi:hypothetical protein